MFIMHIKWIKRCVSAWLVVLLAVFCVACAKDDRSGVTVWVTVQPQRYFVERIGGDWVSAEVLVRPGQSPEMYAPSAAQIARVAGAAAYFGIGMPIEGVLFKRMQSAMSGIRMVQTGGEIAAQHDHSGHGHHGHNCAEVDPHIWLDPVRMVAVVEQMRDVFIELEPSAADLFVRNADGLIAEFRALDQDLRIQLAPYAGRTFFINHPALGHFARRYGLVQRSIEQSGTAPSAGRIADLIVLAREAAVGAIFTQPEFGRTTATILGDALNLEVVELDVLPTDYIAGMTAIANRLEASFAR